MKALILHSLTMIAGTAIAGPDIICSEITSGQSYGVVGDYQSYSFGDVTCNIGDAPFTYNPNTNNHPVFASTIYRLMDGRFEQIGLGFVAHTFFPLQGNACGLGCNAGTPGMLGGGCSDTITPGLAGTQGELAPRIEIDPWAGDYPYPFTTINQTGDAIYKRVKARIADLSHQDALYFVETQYISNEESGADTRNNNASYRRVSFTPATNTPQMQGDTYSQRSAIFAWRDHGLGPDTPDPDVMVSSVSLPGDGVVHIGSTATDLGDGTWRYDYAVQNQNAARGVNALRIPLGFNRKVTDPTFHDIDYLDEVDNQIDGTDWAFDIVSGFAFWEVGAGFDDDPLANAIRWGTTYSFSFVSVHPPTDKVAQLGIFDDPGDGSVIAPIVAPYSGPCRVDMNADGIFNFFDISTWLNAFINGDLNADFTGDGALNFFDASQFLNEAAAGCP